MGEIFIYRLYCDMCFSEYIEKFTNNSEQLYRLTSQDGWDTDIDDHKAICPDCKDKD